MSDTSMIVEDSSETEFIYGLDLYEWLFDDHYWVCIFGNINTNLILFEEFYYIVIELFVFYIN